MPNEPLDSKLTPPSDFADALLWDRLNEFGQLHLLQFWSELTPVQQERFLSQLRAVDLPAMRRLFEMAATDGNDWSDLAEQAKSPPAVTLAEQAEPALRRAAIACGRVCPGCWWTREPLGIRTTQRSLSYRTALGTPVI